MSRIEKGLFFAGGVATALLIAGCGAGTPNSAAPASQSLTGVAQELPASATRRPECKDADLRLWISDTEGTAGTFYRYLVFTNKGHRTCTIQGFPGVSYVTGDDGHQVGPAADRIGAKKPPVTLRPGDSANVTVGFRDVAAFDEAACQPTATRGLRIYPPDEYNSMFVPGEGVGCQGGTTESQLTVTSMEPGTKPA